MLRFKDEKTLHKYGLMLDPSDPSKTIRIGQQQHAAAIDGQRSEPTHAGSDPNTETTVSLPAESAPPQSEQSFTRETLEGALGTYLAGMITRY